MPESGDTQTETAAPFTLLLPGPPPGLAGPVKAWQQDVEILSYLPEKPEVNPMFLEKRVYQGSSGRVYPLPFIDRIAVQPVRKMWKAVHIENEYLRLMVLPEIGGRIHVGYDKTTGYDFFYRQNVIKPALVGLAGPWISGGVEFNWPQHHRPATFMPVETSIEHAIDGSMTVWCSDYDPMLRMKGMHGVCLHPGQALLDLKVRLFNRTPFMQTFLWWANMAARVHEGYQSFFPQDVQYVADHAKRAVTSFPLSTSRYYGIDYGERAETGVPQEEKPRKFVPDGTYPPNDLSWYANIPVPTSYMVTRTGQDFLGGYDHDAQAGVVHVISHHIAPGKKQWTWGNHEFGYAWDRNLTDHDGPYIELMAGVYTDNQPDFSFLAPLETKTFTQCWYPIHTIGVPVAANRDAALSFAVENSAVAIGVHFTRSVGDTMVVLEFAGTELARWTGTSSVDQPLMLKAKLPPGTSDRELSVTVLAGGRELIQFETHRRMRDDPPAVAHEPPVPERIESIEELYLTGLHLEQYRHATRQPEMYWQEGLRRDPGESRLHNALGLWRLRRGEFDEAARHFESAIARLTHLNPNPRDGETHYNLGLARRFQGRMKDAYDAFYKATWSAAWRGPAYFALAECDAASSDWKTALDHLRRSLRADADNLNARHLLGLVLEQLGDPDQAQALCAETLAMDPLDAGARWRQGIAPASGQVCLDLAFDLLRAGQHNEALQVLRTADREARDGSAPMILFTTAYVQALLGLPQHRTTLRQAEAAPLHYCFPSRLEEMLVLEWAIAADDEDWAAHYLLGNLFYDRRRHEEAIRVWEISADRAPLFAVVQRNLGIAYFNIRHNPAQALESFERAFQANSLDARVFYERDQLWKRTGRSAQERLQELLRHSGLVLQRDDLSLELASLYNQAGRSDDALDVLLSRKFQPWEGGEGLVLAQYTRARLLLGRRALFAGDSRTAYDQFQAALEPPDNLGESRHLLANQSDLYYWLGEASHCKRDHGNAAAWWTRAARQTSEFRRMPEPKISDMTFWSALALQRLGNRSEAEAFFEEICNYSFELEKSEPKIDYFATSLPAILLFEEDLAQRNRIESLFLRAQAVSGRGHYEDARILLLQVLEADASHAGAADLLSQLDWSPVPDVAG